jgi:hypothetical protein
MHEDAQTETYCQNLAFKNYANPDLQLWPLSRRHKKSKLQEEGQLLSCQKGLFLSHKRALQPKKYIKSRY